MAMIKCKMCGGDLVLGDEPNIAECAYCGARQTVPSMDNEKMLNLFARANRLRANNEFDKASGVYESIIADFPEEAEAYWGRVLCEYGIEYVDDPATGKKVPACHRPSTESVLDDPDFELVMEYSDSAPRKLYREEAKQIEELRKQIIEIAGKEQPYDIFLCYKENDEKGKRTKDSELAEGAYEMLTQSGYRVFFSRVTLKNKIGPENEPYIYAALHSSKIMLAFGTDYDYYNAVWVKNNWSRYLQLISKGEEKVLIPCFMDLDAYDMPKEFDKLPSQDLGKEGAAQELLSTIQKLLPVDKKKREEAKKEEAKKEEAKKPAQPAPKAASQPTAQPAPQPAPQPAAQPAPHQSVQQKPVTPVQTPKRDSKQAADRPKVKVDPELKKIREKWSGAFPLLTTGPSHTVGVNKNGSVSITKYVGDYSLYKQCNVSEWSDLLGVASGDGFLIGLKSNGTILMTGYTIWLEAIKKWTDIAVLSAGNEHVLGLKADGTVVADGKNNFNDCGVFNWKDIVSISARETYSLGLQADGTVLCAGQNLSGACDVTDWWDIVEISAGGGHSLGLRPDGTVVATQYVGDDYCGQCEVSEWRNIVGIAAGGRHSLGLRSDGTVVSTGNNDKGQCNVSKWRDIIAVFAGVASSIGIKSDGTIMAVGDNSCAALDVAGWRLFDKMDDVEHRRQKEIERIKKAKLASEKRKQEEKVAEEQRRKEEIEAKRKKLTQQIEDAQRELTAYQFEQMNKKGLFSGKRRKEIEAEIAALNQKIPNLQKELDSIKD